MPAGLTMSRDHRGRVTGLAYLSGQCVLAADDDVALDAMAVELRKHRALRSIVGPRAAASGLWSRVQTWHRPPELVRACQPLYAMEPEMLVDIADVPVRAAFVEEAEVVARHSAEMILVELGYDPRTHHAGWVAGVRRAIAAGVWWVWIVDGVLRFQCNVGPRTEHTAQIQGVWTPPELRGHGYATAALAAVARRLLVREATLSLYVNDFNAPAMALYERIGFARVGEFATYLFP